MTHYKCVVVSVSIESLPSVCILLFCCFGDISDSAQVVRSGVYKNVETNSYITVAVTLVRVGLRYTHKQSRGRTQKTG